MTITNPKEYLQSEVRAATHDVLDAGMSYSDVTGTLLVAAIANATEQHGRRLTKEEFSDLHAALRGTIRSVFLS